MKNYMKFVSIDQVKSHERTMSRRVATLIRAIKEEGNIRRPIIVDKRSLIILDGHHRVAALRQLGVARVPAYLVDYLSPNVRVYLRRKYLSMQIIKRAVLYSGLTGEAFPVKTTRHLIHARPGVKKVSLTKLLL